MKIKFFFIVSMLLSINILANSAVFVLTDNSVMRSSKSETDIKNVLKTLNKGQKLQRLTMHYSGWSLVEFENINGWILSSSLTSQAPVIVKSDISKPNTLLTSKISQYQKDVKSLSDQLLEANNKLKELYLSNDKFNKTINELNAKIDELSLENKHLKESSAAKVQTEGLSTVDVENSKDIVKPAQIDTPDAKDTLSVNWIYAGLLLFVVLLLAVLSIYNRNKRRHFDLNTLRR